jgi:FixJ family two-component response regulator
MRGTNGEVGPNPNSGAASTMETVCLVDDDPSIRKSVTRLLQSADYKVNAFAEAEPFLVYLAGNSVSVAVLDIWMARMTGMELLAHLCAQSPNTKVIFITGHEHRAAEATVMQAGAFGFLIKPLDSNEFLAMIERAFATSSPASTRGERKTRQ